MDGELAIHKILTDDSAFATVVGGTGTSARVYYDEAQQTSTLPFSIVSLDGIDPHDNKSGVSRLDFDWVYVIHFAADKPTVNDMARKARAAADRKAGTYYNAIVQSVEFITQKSNSEYLVDKPCFTIEQLYKLTIQET